MTAGASIALAGAAQVLTPPAAGLPYLRQDRAGELRLDPGSVSVRDGVVAALDDDDRAATRIDATGCAVVPGFIDAHTHLPFAGWRAGEYAMKVAGEPYEAISAAGGGIASSARALAETGDDEVLEQATTLAGEMLWAGTTTFEGKSGYGLSVDGELRALRLAGDLGRRVEQRTVATALLAHAVPPGWSADDWMDAVAALLPRVVAETDAVALDVFVESIAFTNGHLSRMGELARRHELVLRCHVEQFATHGSVPVALEAGARSVDHLACLPLADIPGLAAAECAAVLLPGAEFLGAEACAPARALADAGAICVLATDLNPGTSPVHALPTVIGLAVRRYGWTVREALLAVTLNAAWVLGLSGVVGTIEPGRAADLLLLDGPVEQLPYRFARNPVAAVLVGGELAWVRPDQAWRVSG